MAKSFPRHDSTVSTKSTTTYITMEVFSAKSCYWISSEYAGVPVSLFTVFATGSLVEEIQNETGSVGTVYCV